MLNKIYAIIKKIIKEYYLFMIFLVIILFFTLVKFPYVIMTPGGATSLNDRFITSNNYDIKGSINLAYVSEVDANLLMLLIAKINPYWDIVKVKDNVLPNEQESDNLTRLKLRLNESVDTAKLVALKEAGYDVNINGTKVYVAYIMQPKKNNLKINDQIIKIDHVIINSVDDIKNYIATKKNNDVVNITVIRDGKNQECYAKVFLYENSLVIGITSVVSYDYKSPVKIKYISKKQEYGSSGGLMSTLAIYNALVKEDITKGKKIIGTGTIDINGNVGVIDGIKYKLLGASFKKCDIFFVPVENYEEAIKVKEQYHLKIKVVKVATIKEAIAYLKGM